MQDRKGVLGVGKHRGQRKSSCLGRKGAFGQSPGNPPDHGKREEQVKAIVIGTCKEIAQACGESGKALLIEPWDLPKTELKLESVDCVWARSFSFLALRQGDRDGSKSACFAAGVEGIEVDLAYASLMGVVDHARRHGTSFSESAGLGPPLAVRGLCLSGRVIRARGRCNPTQRVVRSPSPYAQGIRQSLCGRFYGGDLQKTLSGARSASPVRERVDSPSRASVPENAGRGRQPWLWQSNPRTRIVGRTLGSASQTILPTRGTVLYGCRNGAVRD
ncbi:hypothetical protein MPNT_30173 [Candidatus Methylacidithermus pantelleriae]|uniref:Uncharacterized protein n=1 Tax=Candidatus Methylacidithermus pantelleriae TaxID=2744239 RepID=A0A8J2BJ94_9BACT|nr:hypothetical protein MPNT_30173 [Candidatus Methylacidithermus pantelleriae]